MLRNKLFGVSSRLGVGRPVVSLYDELVGIGPPLKSRFVRTTAPETAETGPRIVFPYPQGNHLRHLYKYCVLAQAFKLRGHRPLFVLCDRTLPGCSVKPVGKSNDCSNCEICSYRGEQIVEGFGHEWICLSDLVEDRPEYHTVSMDDREFFEYSGVDLYGFAECSVRKIKQKYTLSRAEDEEWFNAFLRSGVLLVDAIETLLKRYDVRTMISHDDKYCWSGVPLAVADQNSVYAYSTRLGWTPDTLVVGRTDHKNSFPHYEKTDFIESFLQKPLNDKQRREVHSLMEDRRLGRDVENHFSAVGDDSIGDRDSPTVGMFTNLIWDASITDEDSLFPNVRDWVEATVRHFVGREGVELIVKTHPAEVARGTNESVKGWIEECLNPQELESIEVLPPSTSVNTHQMLNDIDAAIVYNSTVGVEAAYYGTPVIVGAKTFYRGLSLTYDPPNQSEYLDLLTSAEDLEMTEEMRSRAERYAYFLFVGKHLDFPYFPSEITPEELRVVDDAELEVGNETFDTIVDRMVAGEPVLAPGFNQRMSVNTNSV